MPRPPIAPSFGKLAIGQADSGLDLHPFACDERGRCEPDLVLKGKYEKARRLKIFGQQSKQWTMNCFLIGILFAFTLSSDCHIQADKQGGRWLFVDKYTGEEVNQWLCGQVVRRRSRKPKITGSIPVGANLF
ncbi:hypothetical protein T05_9246 [Trichinella murrelli]|uniref:Uncharacterized protein n=1 Tax=Trichinella murrelli TaxID=144512 RepID=A0A0V0U8J7_9BILA|nr:hypothetical protein T05_9246 [Trichinella murrelli]